MNKRTAILVPKLKTSSDLANHWIRNWSIPTYCFLVAAIFNYDHHNRNQTVTAGLPKNAFIYYGLTLIMLFQSVVYTLLCFQGLRGNYDKQQQPAPIEGHTLKNKMDQCYQTHPKLRLLTFGLGGFSSVTAIPSIVYLIIERATDSGLPDNWRPVNTFIVYSSVLSWAIVVVNQLIMMMHIKYTKKEVNNTFETVQTGFYAISNGCQLP